MAPKVMDALLRASRLLSGLGVENARLDAELLLAHALGTSRETLYAKLQEPLEAEEERRFGRLIERRGRGEPLQYLLGYREFWSIPIRVDPRALIPRPETEHLVEQALELLAIRPEAGSRLVLDLGTGSGAVAVAVARERADAVVVATDISLDALRLARENAVRAQVGDRIGFLQGDLFEAFRSPEDAGPFDLILSNPPYVARGEIDRLSTEVKDHEPRQALDGGEDGLDFYRRIVSKAPLFLKEGGWLLLEVGEGQSEHVSSLIAGGGAFERPDRVTDLSGIERVIRARKASRRKG